MAKNDGALLLGAGALLLLLMSDKNSSASASSSESADWSEWEDADVLDVTPNVPKIPLQLPAPAMRVDLATPVVITANKPTDSLLDITGPSKRPSSPAEIRAALGRDATPAEKAAYDAWYEKWKAELEAERAANNAKQGTSSAASEAAAAAKAAKLAAAAKPTAPPAKQAAGNKVSAALRELVTPTKASAQDAPAPVATRAAAPAKTAPAKPKAIAAAKPKTVAKPAAKPKTVAKPAAKPTAAAPKKVAAPAGTNIALAKSTANDVATHIRNTGTKYKAAVVKQFQQRAGMKGDGLYGPATASALRYFGANAPAPLFKGVNAKYVPPT